MAEKPPLSRLDLNLLTALDALLTERSVTRAAQRLRLSQPALSASLARLRTHFSDPILTRRGHEYELTPLAIRLLEHTSIALEMARRVFESQTEWVPSTSTREFSVYGSDYGFATIGQAVSKLAAARAPAVKLRFMLHSPQIIENIDEKLRSTDALLLPHGFVADLPHLTLNKDYWVVLAATSNNSIGATLSMADMAAAPWVYTYQSRTAFTSVSQQLQHLGVEPRVEAVVESFLSLAPFISGTRRLAMVQSRLADLLVGMGGVRAIEPPFDPTPISNALWWHPIHTHDPEHIWMRQQFVEATACDQDAKVAAGRLQAPVNTVRYRVSRFRESTGSTSGARRI
ncbi:MULTISPECIES: LysR family transcriptional regulator [unclassified Microbacterium]|uniref:LysR family transcriptional regulator n=1 Tax=unclassified Microbacterium TaxID=2609290 RepID=UPI00214C20FA|nr:MULTISPECIES: LysR family transcriptional regulator [unclassified Microbacterium]MCR2784758.1 LysR family transcriptional regulator [Microbacterium sp. zg.B96]WIM16297.1 LysR family transcriptional regulator [Microbacterium sp. zg-B96]